VKKGFTIIELLVASMLLGMLVTILTMVFNQSSIAWRTGVAGSSDLSQTRRDVAQIREEADNVFVANNRTLQLLGLWKENGTLRSRACSAGAEASSTPSKILGLNDSTRLQNLPSVSVRGERAGTGSHKTYVVNVMSAGPDRIFDTYDDIWSFPDEFE